MKQEKMRGRGGRHRFAWGQKHQMRTHTLHTSTVWSLRDCKITALLLQPPETNMEVWVMGAFIWGTSGRQTELVLWQLWVQKEKTKSHISGGQRIQTHPSKKTAQQCKNYTCTSYTGSHAEAAGSMRCEAWTSEEEAENNARIGHQSLMWCMETGRLRFTD